jgi:hypothetical protein
MDERENPMKLQKMLSIYRNCQNNYLKGNSRSKVGWLQGCKREQCDLLITQICTSHISQNMVNLTLGSPTG